MSFQVDLTANITEVLRIRSPSWKQPRRSATAAAGKLYRRRPWDLPAQGSSAPTSPRSELVSARPFHPSPPRPLKLRVQGDQGATSAAAAASATRARM